MRRVFFVNAHDRFGGSFKGAEGVEADRDCRLPLFECPGKAGDFRDGAGRGTE